MVVIGSVVEFVVETVVSSSAVSGSVITGSSVTYSCAVGSGMFVEGSSFLLFLAA